MTKYVYTSALGDTFSVRRAPVTPNTALLSIVFNGAVRGAVYLPADKVEEVCAALREAAGLPPVWTVEKEAASAPPEIDGEGRIFHPYPPGWLTPADARGYASALLAAADEAEARAKRPKLPTARYSMVSERDAVWVRDIQLWREVGSEAWMSHEDMQRRDFAILHDPEKAS